MQFDFIKSKNIKGTPISLVKVRPNIYGVGMWLEKNRNDSAILFSGSFSACESFYNQFKANPKSFNLEFMTDSYPR